MKKLKSTLQGIQPPRSPRHNWAQQFKLMAERGDDELLDNDLSTTPWEKMNGSGLIEKQVIQF